MEKYLLKIEKLFRILNHGDFTMGKFPYDILHKFVFSRLGKIDPSVLFGPSIGEDAAVVDLGNIALICHVDPITGAVENIGWLAVHIACNDVAVRGGEPRWILPCILLPEQNSIELLDKITLQIDKAAKTLGVMVIAGHTETTVGLERPIITMTAIGLAPKEKIVPISGAKPGDVVLVTKGIGLEGTSILATDFAHELRKRGVPDEIIMNAREFIKEISVVKDALAIRDYATAMHDPTEGGLIGALTELACASNVLIRIKEEDVLIRRETEIICSALQVDPLKLISSGTLLATVRRNLAEKAINKLQEIGITAKIIGIVEKGYGVEIIRKDGSIEKFTKPVVKDELFRLLEEEKIKFK